MARVGLASSLALVAAFVVAPTVARAAQCKVDADCPKGWLCDDVGEEECSASGCAADDLDCSTEVVCESVSDYRCVPDSCTDDTDCDVGMTCYQVEDSSCSDAAPAVDCPDGETCAEPAPAECDEPVRSACIPDYVLPCSKDADCGAGFECVADEVCECTTARPTASAGGTGPVEVGTGAAAGVQATDSGDSGCTCTPTDMTQCRPIDESQTCDGDSDCPSGWTCNEISTVQGTCSAPAEPMPAGGTSGVAGAAADLPFADDDDDDACETTTTTEKLCVPPYFDLVGGSESGGSLKGDTASDSVGDDDDDAAVEPTARGYGGETASADDDDDAREDANVAAGAADQAGADDDDASPASGFSDDDSSWSSGASDDDDDDDTGSAAGAPGDDDDDTARGSSNKQSDEGCGCRVGGGSMPGSGFWLGMLGLIGLGLRRRRDR